MALASVFLVLLAAEGLGLALAPSQTRNYGRYTEDYIGFHPVLGAAPRQPGIFSSTKIDVKTGAIIYDVEYTIDEHLLRKTSSLEKRPTIAFFGDSFTFGEGVNDSETLPQAFADLYHQRIRVLNLGFHGYGPQHFLRILETGIFDYLLRQSLRLFVFQTAPWHAERSSCRADFTGNAPKYVLQNGRVVFSGACGVYSKFVMAQFAKSAAYRLFVQPAVEGAVSRSEVELYIAVVTSAVRLAKERYSVPTAILYFAYHDKYLQHSGFSNEDIVRRLRDSGAHVIDVTLTASDGTPLTRYDVATDLIIPNDYHPTALAHGIRAKLLENFLTLHLPDAVSAQE